ncbi:MAG: HYR domain-containing protein [Bacteroidetes bacterium]|nr:HYR domain-containing protein [Bacteroidota bacterium]
MQQSNDPGLCSAVVAYSAFASDNCSGVSIACLPATTTFPVGVSTVTCTATDAAGNTNTCSFTVTIFDTENPNANCPAAITQSNDAGLCSAVVSYSASASDNCSGATVSCSPSSGSIFPAGVTTVNCIATDAAGNTSACSFTVTINDNENPTANCPANIIQGNDVGDCGAIVTYTATASDNCAGATVSCLPVSGGAFPVGVTTVNCIATDASGNTGTCSFTVTVNDNENPVAHCPASIQQSNDPGLCSAVVAYSAFASDNCSGVSIACLPATTTFPVGVSTVTCTATDAAGNTNTCSFTVTIFDTENPTANCPAAITQSNDAGLCSAVVSYSASASDNCSGATVSCSPSPGSIFPAGVTTVNCIATDAAGNTSACSFTVTVLDNENPIANCPGNITTCNSLVTYSATATDNCSGATISCSPASGSTFPAGLTTVNCIATDANSNTATCSFSVNVQTISTASSGATSTALYGQICLGGNVTLTANGGSLGTGASWVWYEGGCGTGGSIGTGASITITPATNGAHVYFVRAQGACGNTACVSVTVNVISAPPSNTIGITAAPSDGCVSAPAQTVSVNAVANCTFYNWSSSQAGVRFNGFPSPYQTSVPSVSVTYVSLPAGGSSGWSICVFGGNSCGNTNTVCTWVRATLGAPTSISGALIGCPGTSGNAYSTGTVAGAVSYQWSSTGGIVVTGNGAQAITVSFPAGFVTGTLSVRGQTSCGYMGPNRTITINANPAIPGAISGTSYPCPNASSTYSIAPVTGAANYTWTTSVAGAVVTGNSTSCSILFPAAIPGGSTVSVIANSSCPTSSAVRSKGIVGGLPSFPAAISGPVSGQCGQTGVSYFINPVSNATGYSWSSTCGTIVGPINLSGISMDWASNMTSCIISVSSVNACGNSAPRTLLVTGAPNTPTSISGPLSVCANDVSQYCANGSNGATSFQWTVPAGATILGPANGVCILVQWGATGGTIIARALNDCGMSGSKTQAVAVTCRNAQVSGVSIPSVEIFPNPTTGKVNIQYYASESTSLSIQAMDITGRIILTQDLITDPGINIHELDLSSLAKGVYMIHLNGKEINEMLKVTVE